MKTKNKKFKSKNNNLKRYIKNLKKTTVKCPKINKKKCFNVSSKSKQKIDICEKYVYKTPMKNENKLVIKTINDNIIQINSNTMNLLIQSLIKLLVKNKKINKNIEHYNKICNIKNNYSLQSKKKIWSGFNTIEDYMLNCKNINLKLIEKWVKQIFKILDELYDTIQFHHCDPKASQILLNSNGDAVLSDFDKVTFTLNINNIPKRIILYSYFRNQITNLNFNPALSMRFELNPRNSNDFEKACFLSSIILLSPSELIDNKLRKLSKKLLKYNIYMINPKSAYQFKSNNSLTAAARYVTIKSQNKVAYSTNLKSKVNINEKNELEIIE